jgi:hypothetical protein
MAETLGGLGRLTELRQRLLFVVAALIIYRIGTFIPVPGVNPQALLQFMNSQQGTIVDVFNLFTGGALERFSLLHHLLDHHAVDVECGTASGATQERGLRRTAEDYAVHAKPDRVVCRHTGRWRGIRAAGSGWCGNGAWFWLYLHRHGDAHLRHDFPDVAG